MKVATTVVPKEQMKVAWKAACLVALRAGYLAVWMAVQTVEQRAACWVQNSVDLTAAQKAVQLVPKLVAPMAVR